MLRVMSSLVRFQQFCSGRPIQSGFKLFESRVFSDLSAPQFRSLSNKTLGLALASHPLAITFPLALHVPWNRHLSVIRIARRTGCSSLTASL
jgi:hypothetical protein